MCKLLHVFPVLTNLNPLHPMMFCAKFDQNWPCGKKFTDRRAEERTDRQTDGRRTKSELSARMTKKG